MVYLEANWANQGNNGDMGENNRNYHSVCAELLFFNTCVDHLHKGKKAKVKKFYMPSKPIKVNFKLYAVCDRSGYI